MSGQVSHFFYNAIHYFERAGLQTTVVLAALVLIAACATPSEPLPVARTEVPEREVAPPADEQADRPPSPAERDDQPATGEPAAVEVPPEQPPPPPPQRTVEATVAQMISRMSLAERIGQLLIVAYPLNSRGAGVYTMDGRLEAILRELQPGGFILFGSNIDTAGQVREFVQSMQTTTRLPMLIAVDQEGGTVRRLRPGPGLDVVDMPSARVIGSSGDRDLAYRLARIVGRELRSLGITMNFAPVADVLTDPEATTIGSRAFGSQPDLVAEMVVATVRGFQDAGVSAVAKHFPGHGSTAVDTHERPAIVDASLSRLREVELVPFRAAAAAGVDGVLTAHITVTDVGAQAMPATFESRLLHDLLREEIGFDGVVVSDSLVMEAARAVAPAGELSVRAVEAGVDLLLWPPDPRIAHRAIMAAVDSGRISHERLNESVGRILALKFERGLLSVLPVTGTLPPDRVWPEEEPVALRVVNYFTAEATSDEQEPGEIVDTIRRAAGQ